MGIFLYPMGGVLEPPVICSEPLCFSFICCSEQRKREDLFSPLVVFIMRLFGLFIVFWLISGLEDLRPTTNSPEKLSWKKVLQVDVMVRGTIPEVYSLGVIVKCNVKNWLSCLGQIKQWFENTIS